MTRVVGTGRRDGYGPATVTWWRRARRAPPRASLYPRRLAVAQAMLVAFAAMTAVTGEGSRADGAPHVAAADTALAAPSGTPTIAVASSLRTAWPALERAWREALPAVGARPTFGASHVLARQIVRGAPFELFLAADEASVELVPAARLVDGTSSRYATGRLALVTRDAFAGAAVSASTTTVGAAAADPLAELAARLAAAPGARLAIADPDHAPYGRAAREALDGAGLWPVPSGRLITGENAAQTLQFVLAGGVDAAVVPASLLAAGVPSGVQVAPIEPSRHSPLVHRLVVLHGATPAARALGTWFASPAARDALAAAGFDAPP